jgi:hypothetical protein
VLKNIFKRGYEEIRDRKLLEIWKKDQTWLKYDSDEIYLISRILNPVNLTDAKNSCIFQKESFDIRQKQFNVG